MAEAAREGTRRGGRAARRALRQAAPIVMFPSLVRNIPVYEILDAEGVDLIHEESCRILEEVGIDFRDDEALALWREAGAEIDGQRLRLPRELVLAEAAKTPETFTLHGRNPEKNVLVGGRNTVFAPSYGSPYVLDFEGERRYGTLDDLHAFHKLAHMAPALHLSGAITCEPVDIPVPYRHLRVGYSSLKHSDKAYMGAVTAKERAADYVAMAKLVFGETYLQSHPVMISVCNCNSPLVWDQTMLDAVRVYARNNQPVLLSPFVMAGANTPASSAGAVAQLNAEALAGLAFAQLVNPGCPMVYGQFFATVSMKSGAPMAGTPEIAHMNYMLGQLARRYRVPWRSSGMVAGSKLPDAQAAYESVMTMHAVMLAGANYVFHSAGWLEAGLTASFAKFMLDAEQVAMWHKYMGGVPFDDFGDAMAAVREVGPAGHYLGTAHTRAQFETAFFMPDLLDNNSYEQWLEEGATDAASRGLAAARVALDRYEEPALDIAVDEALRDFIARRESELPADAA